MNELHPIEGDDSNDDIVFALADNPQPGFKEEDIAGILAEIPGENDEFDWHWILELQDKRYVYVWGGCDYTGWG